MATIGYRQNASDVANYSRPSAVMRERAAMHVGRLYTVNRRKNP